MRDAPTSAASPVTPSSPEFPGIFTAELRTLTWEKLGIVRAGDDLRLALEELDGLMERPSTAPTRSTFELRNMVCVAKLIARCALERRESRGGHFRVDYPEKDPAFRRRSTISLHDGYRLDEIPC